MTRTRAVRGAALSLGLATAVAVLAIGGSSRVSADDPSPSWPAPVVTPSPIATPIPSPVVTPAPSQPAEAPDTIDLVDPLGHDVHVLLDDETGQVVRARSGRPGDGMSVRWYAVKLSLIDDDTIRLTWVGLPGDVEIGVAITEDGKGRLRIAISQPIPPRDSDALGVDRILELDLDRTVSADDVVANIVMD
jgi:hypothetical protein